MDTTEALERVATLDHAAAVAINTHDSIKEAIDALVAERARINDHIARLRTAEARWVLLVKRLAEPDPATTEHDEGTPTT